MTDFGWCAAGVMLAVLLLPSPAANAQGDPLQGDGTAVTAPHENTLPPTATVVCASRTPGRTQCPANTSAGVVLVRSTGPGECLLGRTWGYDQASVWVSDGCSGVFLLGPPTAATQEPEAPQQPPRTPQKPPVEQWGEFIPGEGFLIGRSSAGELSVSVYALLRYLNQMPGGQTFTDHLGNRHSIDSRNDFFSHRIILWLKGWVGLPRLQYMVILWTVNTTDQKAIFGNIGYQFSRKFSVYGGINGNPGTRSLQGSHPYWLAPDRVLADEFFRPYFSFGVFAQGELVPGFWYNTMLADNSSSLGITAVQLDRKFSTASASVWWMPTTHEFGPRGAYGDWEMHDRIATRFGASFTYSPEERYTDSVTGATGNTTVKLVDSLNVFDAGALAPGVTVQRVNYRVLSFDAGAKYRGIFLQTEIYTRWLNHFVADGPVPLTSIVDKGFYVQGAFFAVPKKLELYGITSQIYGDKGAGFRNSSEYIAGLNYYPANTRNHRLNVQVMDMNRSPASSTFGYYVGGQRGTTVSTAFSVFF